MPTYVYRFVHNDETIEVQQAFSDDTLTEVAHPADGTMRPVRKVFTPVGVTFKGSGFYKTDSKGGSKSSSTSAASTSTSESGSGSTTPASTPASSSDSSGSSGSSGSSPSSSPSSPPSSSPSTGSTPSSAVHTHRHGGHSHSH